MNSTPRPIRIKSNPSSTRRETVDDKNSIDARRESLSRGRARARVTNRASSPTVKRPSSGRMRARVWAYASHGVLCRWSSDVVVYACEGGWVGFRMVYLSVSGRFYTFQVCVYGGKVIYKYVLNQHKWWTRWRGRRRGTGRRRAGIARARDSSVDRSVGGLVRDPSAVVRGRPRAFVRSFVRSFVRQREDVLNRIESKSTAFETRIDGSIALHREVGILGRSRDARETNR